MRGNLNGTRFPWRVYWRKRPLKPEQRWVLALVRDYVPELVADKGEVSVAERRLIETSAAARCCWLLAIASPIDGSRAEAARFMAIEATCLKTLGLARRAKDVSLASYVEARREPPREPGPAP